MNTKELRIALNSTCFGATAMIFVISWMDRGFFSPSAMVSLGFTIMNGYFALRLLRKPDYDCR